MREYLGQCEKVFGAVHITPAAERTDGGPWEPVEHAKKLFPPDGKAEAKVLPGQNIGEGDWAAFIVQGGRARGSRLRASSLRRLFRFIEFGKNEPAETRRRILVEKGVDGSPGEYVVQVEEDGVAKVLLSKGKDGKLRAKSAELIKLDMKRFNLSNVVRWGALNEHLLYEFDPQAETTREVNWAAEVDYIAVLAEGLKRSGKNDVANALEVIAKFVEDSKLGDAVTFLGQHDPAVFKELQRSGEILKRLEAERAVLDLVATSLLEHHLVLERLSQEAEQMSQAHVSRIIGEAQVEHRALMLAERTQATAALEKELGERADQEARRIEGICSNKLNELERSLEDKRTQAIRLIESETACLRSEQEQKLAQTKQELESLAEARADLDRACKELKEKKVQASLELDEVLKKIEIMTSAKAALSEKPGRVSAVLPSLSRSETERRIGLFGLRKELPKIKILSGTGIGAVNQALALMLAGEVPVIVGPQRQDLIEVLALTCTGGRLAQIAADPATITLEDLWTRPGGTGTTALGLATDAAAGWQDPILCVVSDAQNSTEQFWFSMLCDSVARGNTAKGLLFVVTEDTTVTQDTHSIAAGINRIVADALFTDSAGLIGAKVLSELKRSPMTIEMEEVEPDFSEVALAISRAQKVVSPFVGLRAARLHAVASKLMEKSEAANLLLKYLE
jgi:hypothetical protein